LPDGLEAGAAGGVGGPVVLAGHPDDRVRVVLAGFRDGDAGAEGQGGFAVMQGLAAVGIVGVGGDAVVGVEPVEGLLEVAGGGLDPGCTVLDRWVSDDILRIPVRSG
jgi:hypothetical protein